MRRVLPFAVLVVVTLSTPLCAEIYEYTDSKGVAHFVDDPSRIPAKYRNQKKVRSDSDDTAAADGAGLEGKSLEELERMASRGNPAAQNWLAAMYINGDEVRQDRDKALKLFALSAAQGYAAAQYNLGKAYHFGDGVPTNLAKAEELYTKAAEQGYKDAENNLGSVLQSRGRKSESLKWFLRAASHGNVNAMQNLGRMYERGDGVRRDLNEAQKWYRKAADAGY